MILFLVSIARTLNNVVLRESLKHPCCHFGIKVVNFLVNAVCIVSRVTLPSTTQTTLALEHITAQDYSCYIPSTLLARHNRVYSLYVYNAMCILSSNTMLYRCYFKTNSVSF